MNQATGMRIETYEILEEFTLEHELVRPSASDVTREWQSEEVGSIHDILPESYVSSTCLTYPPAMMISMTGVSGSIDI